MIDKLVNSVSNVEDWVVDINKSIKIGKEKTIGKYRKEKFEKIG